MSTHPQRFGPAYTLKRERQRRYYHRNRLRLLAAHRWWGYRCSPEVYEQLLSAQAGVCAICKMPETAKWKTRVRQLAVDHDHSTGQIRGLLCAACNAGIGNLRNDPTLLKAAAAYLEIQVERRLTQQVLPVPERNPNHWAKQSNPGLSAVRTPRSRLGVSIVRQLAVLGPFISVRGERQSLCRFPTVESRTSLQPPQPTVPPPRVPRGDSLMAPRKLQTHRRQARMGEAELGLMRPDRSRR